MKTIKALLKEWIKRKRKGAEDISDVGEVNDVNENLVFGDFNVFSDFVANNDNNENNGNNAKNDNNDKNNNIGNNANNTNTSKNETETNENPGDNRMVHPISQQTDRNDQDNQKQPESGGTEFRGTGKPGEGDLETMLQAAYREGVTAGRNQAIEELYFPKDDDGVPMFNGSTNKVTSGADIFSMAREA